jgi:hypothetical protein
MIAEAMVFDVYLEIVPSLARAPHVDEDVLFSSGIAYKLKQ